MEKPRLQVLMDEYALWYHLALINKKRDSEPSLKEWIALKLEQVDNAGELVLRPEEKSLINKLK